MKKKGRCKDSFYVSNDKFRLDDKRVRLPRIGRMKMRESLRFDGKIVGTTVSRIADHWFLSVQVETEAFPSPSETQVAVVGVDLGIKHLAVLSDGRTFDNPKPLSRALRKLGSTNRKRAAGGVARLHARIACIRQDGLHKLTTGLVRDYGHVVTWDSNVKGMLRNRRLARAVADVGFGELQRQLT